MNGGNGGYGGGYPQGSCSFPGQDLTYGRCAGVRRPVCDMQKLGAMVSAAVAPQATWTITPGPTNAEYFQVLAARTFCPQFGNNSLVGDLFVQQWDVNQQPVHSFVNGAPGLTNFNGVWWSGWSTPIGGMFGYGVPEPGYIISQPNLIQRLIIGGTSFYSASQPSFLPSIELFGNALATMPPGTIGGFCPDLAWLSPKAAA